MADSFALFLFFLSIVAGFLTKATDELETRWAYISGLLYGLLLGSVVSNDPLFAVVFLPAVLANVLAGKVDTAPHRLALLALVAVLFLRGTPAVTLLWAALAFAAALGDELLDLRLFYPRPLLPLAAVAISFLAQSPTPLLAVLTFDAGYLVADNLWKNKDEEKPENQTSHYGPRKKRGQNTKPLSRRLSAPGFL